MSGKYKPNPDFWHYKLLKLHLMSDDVHVIKHHDIGLFTSESPEPSDYTPRPDKLPMDFCSYWRRVALWPAIALGINLTLIGVGIVALLMSPLITTILLWLGTLVFILLVCLVIAGTIHVVEKDIVKLKDEGLLKTKYNSVKSKYCPLVEYENNDQ